MPVCVLCESETFDSIDGLYFCQSCGTQSQDIRDEDVGDGGEVPHAHLQVSKKGKRGAKRQFFPDKGKPWFMYEAYQHIIKVQVEYLIRIGVDPALKDVVFKLWYKYLQITGNAFTGSPGGQISTKAAVFYCRDAELLGKNKRKRGQQKNDVGENDDVDDDELELCSHFSDEEFYEGDDPSKVPLKDDVDEAAKSTVCPDDIREQDEEVLSNDDSLESSEDEFVGSIAVKQQKQSHARRSNKQTNRVRNGHVSLKFTLAFCYLGLLWINEPVFLSDLMRWAKQGQLPFFQVTRHMPGYMKFGLGDFACLCPRKIPLLKNILQIAAQIAKLLQLPQFPEQKWFTYTTRYITDLHLPGFLHGIVQSLMEKVKIKGTIYPATHAGRQSCIPNFEAGAMAFIVVAMKLCYGIDDKTERKQEASAEPVLSSSENEYCETVPLFTDWLKSWKSCEAKKMENGIPWTDEQFKLLRNPTAYASFCRSDIFGSWEPTDKVYTGTQQKNFRVNRTTNEESQDRYAQLFKSLMSREKEQEFSNLTTPQVTSFPGTCTHGNRDTCSHEAAGSKKHCFASLRSRGVNQVTLLEDEHDSEYICYLLDKNNQTTFHSSYETLLNILADRIEMKPVDIQVKVSELENALFFSKPLRSGWL